MCQLLRAKRFAIPASGLFVLLLAFVWWGIVFQQQLAKGIISPGQALQCTAFSSSLCDLAMALCQGTHFLGIKYYSPELFWIGLALTLVSLVVYAASNLWNEDQRH